MEKVRRESDERFYQKVIQKFENKQKAVDLVIVEWRGSSQAKNEKMSKLNQIVSTMVDRIEGLQSKTAEFESQSPSISCPESVANIACTQTIGFLDLLSSENQHTGILDEIVGETNTLRSNVSWGH